MKYTLGPDTLNRQTVNMTSISNAVVGGWCSPLSWVPVPDIVFFDEKYLVKNMICGLISSSIDVTTC